MTTEPAPDPKPGTYAEARTDEHESDAGLFQMTAEADRDEEPGVHHHVHHGAEDEHAATGEWPGLDH